MKISKFWFLCLYLRVENRARGYIDIMVMMVVVNMVMMTVMVRVRDARGSLFLLRGGAGRGRRYFFLKY